MKRTMKLKKSCYFSFMIAFRHFSINDAPKGKTEFKKKKMKMIQDRKASNVLFLFVKHFPANPFEALAECKAFSVQSLVTKEFQCVIIVSDKLY